MQVKFEGQPWVDWSSWSRKIGIDRSDTFVAARAAERARKSRVANRKAKPTKYESGKFYG